MIDTDTRKKLLIKRINEFERLNQNAADGNISIEDSETLIKLIDCMSKNNW